MSNYRRQLDDITFIDLSFILIVLSNKAQKIWYKMLWINYCSTTVEENHELSKTKKMCDPTVTYYGVGLKFVVDFLSFVVLRWSSKK